MDFDQVFTEVDAQALQENGLLTPCDSSGFVRVHKRRLHRSSDEENRDIPLPRKCSLSCEMHLSEDDANTCLVPDVPVPASAFSRIPNELRSQATLEYLGYSQEKAREIWIKWDTWDTWGETDSITREVDPNPSGGLQMTFFEFATGPVSTYSGVVDTASEDDQEWYHCMNAYGIGEELQQAIMHPSCKNVRLTQSCRFWVRNTFDLRFFGLLDFHDASVERTHASHQIALQPLPGTSQNQETSRAGQRTISGEQRAALPCVQTFDTIHNVRQLAAARAPGGVVLWKGVDSRRVQGLLDAAGSLADISKLISPPPGDFNGQRSVYYLTPSLDVAEQFAHFAKRRDENSGVVLVRLELPHSVIETLQEPEIQRLFWPDQQWKELVWYCRRGQKPPRPLLKFTKAALLIGHISKGPSWKYGQMPSPDTIGESHVFDERSTSQLGVQYVFRGDKGEDLLAQHHKIEIIEYRRRFLVDSVNTSDQ
ncbi:hypothetical protein LIA77_09773 [Sarocladium implicatum]|nr:hypothetical protein LIA77_09773 [Sarocladium implicatum]